MKSSTLDVPAVVESRQKIIFEDVVVEPAKKVLVLELDAEEAEFLQIILGKRTGHMNGGYAGISRDIYLACADFVDEQGTYTRSARSLALAEGEAQRGRLWFEHTFRK